MKIVLVGASGTIGSAVCRVLSSRHEIVKVGRKSGDFQCDITEEKQIRELFKKIGAFDALIATAGNVHFGNFEEMTPELYHIGLHDKLMGQINLVLAARECIRDGGSFTLTSGILSHDPIRSGTSASMVNGAIDGFVRAASIEMPRGLRINAVSPSILIESIPKYEAYFRGFDPVAAERVALAYSKSVEGHQTGQVYHVG